MIKGWLMVTAGMAGAAMPHTPVSALEAPSLSPKGRPVFVWEPKEMRGPAPLVVFSHGYQGCSLRFNEMFDALAHAGYMVVAPTHRDNSCPVSEKAPKRDRSTYNPDTWDASNFRDRAEDIREVIGRLKKDETFAGKVDFSRMALAGYSLGGYSTLGIASGWVGWTIPEVKAVIVFSPLCKPIARDYALADIGVPVMMQGGSKDFLTVDMKGMGGCYSQLPAPKYYVEFNDATHDAWAMTRPRNPKLLMMQVAIHSYTLGFLDHYVKGEPEKGRLTENLPSVNQLHYESYLGSDGGGMPQ